eukprot:Awhi_evm1s12750
MFEDSRPVPLPNPVGYRRRRKSYAPIKSPTGMCNSISTAPDGIVFRFGFSNTPSKDGVEIRDSIQLNFACQEFLHQLKVKAIRDKSRSKKANKSSHLSRDYSIVGNTDAILSSRTRGRNFRQLSNETESDSGNGNSGSSFSRSDSNSSSYDEIESEVDIEEDMQHNNKNTGNNYNFQGYNAFDLKSDSIDSELQNGKELEKALIGNDNNSSNSDKNNSETNDRNLSSKITCKIDGLDKTTIKKAARKVKKNSDGTTCGKIKKSSKSLSSAALRRQKLREEIERDPTSLAAIAAKNKKKFRESWKEKNGGKRECTSCLTQKTPMWRDSPEGIPYCNACGIRYKKHRIQCVSCYYIPRKEEKHIPVCPKCNKQTVKCTR